MKPWEKAIKIFLAEWKDKTDITAALVCGSFITGSPSNRSDIDIHIILSDKVTWRERGNKYINGMLVEYFANPPRQIRKYFEEDHDDNSTMSMVQFITGKEVFDKSGVIKQLKEEAMVWKDKSYNEINKTLLEIKKYGLWDAYDNLLDCYETERQDFDFVYYNSLLTIF